MTLTPGRRLAAANRLSVFWSCAASVGLRVSGIGAADGEGLPAGAGVAVGRAVAEGDGEGLVDGVASGSMVAAPSALGDGLAPDDDAAGEPGPRPPLRAKRAVAPIATTRTGPTMVRRSMTGLYGRRPQGAGDSIGRG